MSSVPVTEPAEWTIGRLLSWTTDYFRRHEVEDPRLACEVLLAHAAGCRRIDLYTRFDRPLDAPRIDAFRGLIQRAVSHEPVAYLVGEKEFFSLPFVVTPQVLIPRPDTEWIVQRVVDHCHQAALARPKLLDVATGCGCIAVAALVNLPGATAVATDLSAAALDVARINGQRHGVMERLTLVRADRLEIPPSALPSGGFDVLMCNPPYIPAAQFDRLPPLIRDYEPRRALTDEADGLSFYRTIAAGASRLLSPGGAVILEVGDGQANEVISTMLALGSFHHRATAEHRKAERERVLTFSRGE